uniref:Uncharacterized protein n=1 Tax=Equus asinus asinus TaxID=83772 RepID=A0A8C4L4T0_EQUAS
MNERMYMWFEGVPFPTMDFTPELMREAWESFVFKDEDVLILTYPKSGMNKKATILAKKKNVEEIASKLR